MFIITDGNFLINGIGRNAIRLHEDNLNLGINAIDWLTDKSGLADIRTKTVTYRSIKDLSDGAKNLIKYFNFLFPIILIITYGFLRFERNKIKSKKLKETDYTI